MNATSGLVVVLMLAAALTALPSLRGRRAGAAVLLAASLAASWTGVTTDQWPGPLSGLDPGLALGRLPGAALAAGLAAMAVLTLLAPSHRHGDTPLVAALAATATVVMGATTPLLWACGVLLMTTVTGVAWTAANPNRAMLSMPRVAGVGAVFALAAAVFLPVPAEAKGAWPQLVGWLLAGATTTLIALPPVGGWAVAALPRVSGIGAAAWLAIGVPAVVLTSVRLPAALPPIPHDILTHVLLDAGLAGAVWNAIWLLIGAHTDRFWRLALADISLVAAGIGADKPMSAAAAVLILAGLVLAVPLLGVDAGQRAALPSRLSWLALSGLPPGIAFWGRLLALETLAGTGQGPLAAGGAAAVLMTAGAVRALRAESAGPAAARLGPALGVAVAAVSLGVGLLPHIVIGLL